MAQGTTRGVPIDTDPLLAADSDLLVASQKATKAYADTKQTALGFTPENVANKSTSTSLGTSNTLYPSQNAVKSYVDTGLATKQNSLGFTPEDVANKQSAVSTNAAHYYNAPYINTLADNRAQIIAKLSNTTFTGVATERCLLVIPLDIDGFNYNYLITNWCRLSTGGGGDTLVRLGTVASPIDGSVGANSIGQQTLIATYTHGNNNRTPFKRTINIYGGASGSVIRASSAASIINDETGVNSPSTTSPIDMTVQRYLYLSFNLTNSALTYTVYSAVCSKIKMT